jgi:hypothetical protein
MKTHFKIYSHDAYISYNFTTVSKVYDLRMTVHSSKFVLLFYLVKGKVHLPLV